MNVLLLLTPKKDVIFEYEDASMRQLIEKMSYHRHASIPILRKDGTYLKSLREGDVLHKILDMGLLDYQKMNRILISDLHPFKDYKSLSVSAGVEEVLQIIVKQNFIPVVDDQGIFIGIIKRGSVMDALKKQIIESENVK